MSFPKISPSSADFGSRSSPRLACRIVRQWRAIASDGGARHVESCADCQQYFRAIAGMERTLRHDALHGARETDAGSATLERDILRAVRESASRPVQESNFSGRAGWLASGIAAAAAAVVAVTAITRESANDRRLSREGAALVLDTVGTLSNELVDKAIPSAGELVAKNPLQQEIGSVYSDMQSALNFLALNFLPTTTEAQPRRSTG